MKTLKIYSKQKPKFPLSVKTYKIDANGTKSDSTWYSKIETVDYDATKSMLEGIGYIAEPASSREIENKEYTIFKDNNNVN
jgi:hypothetical protein